MQYEDIINQTIAHVKETLKDAESGHDWWHIYRVWKTAKTLAQTEEVDPLVVELAALLHDIADAKFHGGDEAIGPQQAREFLNHIGVKPEIAGHVALIVKHISFKGGHGSKEFISNELNVVQDADRLDAIGAIGIARAFSYGGYKNREMYNPEIAPKPDQSKEEYKNSTAPTINHFYEKLLLLKDLMNTKTGRAMAEERHRFMESYLTQFYNEWEGL